MSLAKLRSMIALNTSGVGSAGSTGFAVRIPVHQFRTSCFLRAFVDPFATRFQIGLMRCILFGCRLLSVHMRAMSSSGSPFGCCGGYIPTSWACGCWNPRCGCCCGRCGRCVRPGNARSWSIRCQSASVMGVPICLLMIGYICTIDGIVGCGWFVL